MAKKLRTLLEKLGAKVGDPETRFTIDGAKLGLVSVFGGEVGTLEVDALSDEAVSFVSPPELAAVGPLWVAMLDTADQVKSAIRDAHARVKARLDDDGARLTALGVTVKLVGPDPVARGELVVGGHVAVISHGGNDGLLVREVSGRRVPQKSQAIGMTVDDATAESLKKAVGELMQKMQRAGLLTGRGMFDGPTHRGPLPDAEKATRAPAAEPESASASSSEPKKAPRPKRRPPMATEASERSSGEREPAGTAPPTPARAEKPTTVTAKERSSKPASSALDDAPKAPAPPPSQTPGPTPSPDVAPSVADELHVSPMTSPGEESLLPSPAVAAAASAEADRPAPPNLEEFSDDVATRQISAQDIAELKAKAMRSLGSGGELTSEPSSTVGPATGVEAARATAEASPEPAVTVVPGTKPAPAAAHADDQDEDDEGDEDDDEAAAFDDGVDETRVRDAHASSSVEDDASEFDVSVDTGVAPILSVPENSEEELMRALEDYSSEEEAPAADDDDEMLASPTDVAQVRATQGDAVHALVGDGEENVPSVETGETKVYDEPEEHTAIGAPMPALPVDASQASAFARAKTGADLVDDDAAKDATAASPGAASSELRPVSLADDDVPAEFDAAQETGEHPHTVSAEGTFNALRSVVGEGLSTGKTGAFILDAAAFNYLQGDSADDEVERLEREAARLEAELSEVRSQLIALKAGKLQAAQRQAPEETAPKGRLARKKAEILEKRRQEEAQSMVDASGIASVVEPADAEAKPHADEAPSLHDGVALADVRALLSEEAGRAERTQLVEVSFSHLSSGDEDGGGVFDSPSQVTSTSALTSRSAAKPPSRSDIDSFEMGADDIADADVVEPDGETRIASVRSAAPEEAVAGPVGIVVADPRALERLKKHLEEQYDEIVGLAALSAGEPNMAAFRALVLIRPKPDDDTLARLQSLAAAKRRPQVLCLSSDPAFDRAPGIDLRIELAKKAGEVAQQVIDGLSRLGVEADAR